MFIILIILLIAAALLIVNIPLIRKSDSHKGEPVIDRDALNVEATRQQIRDIESDVEYDLIANDQLGSIKAEAENTLLMEMQDSSDTALSNTSRRFNRWTAVVLSVFVTVFALLVYLSVGSPQALLQTTEQSAQPTMEELLSKLEQRLADNPGDQEGWLVLAQTNMMMQRFDEAVIAMERLHQLAPDSPDVLARYADTLTMANNGRFTTKAEELIEQTLALDPAHVHGLWLAGVQAFQAEEFEKAVSLFEQARVNIDDVENLAQIDALIENAREKSGASQASSDSQADVDAAALTVTVDVAAQVKDKLSPEQTLFVFARAASGPPMPLAVSKHPVTQFPLEVSLDDSMAMMPELKLSAFDEVIITARISNSGQPLEQPGDLVGRSAKLNPQNVDALNITIDRVVE